MSVNIKIENVLKKYGETVVIPNLEAEVKSGEFFTLLGPSGCGKTTLLRMIAGFNTIEGGLIKFDDSIINDIPAHKRNIGMVFQNYAIFPHLTVRQNIEYGLKIRKLDKVKIQKEVDKILDIVKIKEHEHKLPEKLSGGQQQRVALARAIVIYPTVLLMDEPLSNLDAKLRLEMRSAIKEIQKTIGITTVYVTHDQEEALAISDRIAVMNKGEIEQIARPESIYTRPYSVFVSNFIGSSNLFKGNLTKKNHSWEITLKNGSIITMTNIIDDTPNGEVCICIRPEEWRIESNGMEGKILNKTFLGKYINYSVKIENNIIELSQDIGQTEEIYKEGDKIKLLPNTSKINIFTAEGTKNLIKGVVKYEEY
ncbi:MAG: ABC transporter ATP-binding protein [Lachnospirales bacterium]